MKRGRQTTAEESSSDSPAAAASSSLDHKRSRTDDASMETSTSSSCQAGGPVSPDEAHVAAIVAALRAKPEWQRKVADPELARRYALEAAEQGASPVSVAAALRRLLDEAVRNGGGGGGFGHRLAMPPARKKTTFTYGFGTKDYWHRDGTDVDYVVDEDDETLWTTVAERDAGGNVIGELQFRDDVKGVRYLDGVVPEELRARLEAQLDAIADVPDKDFHPGSDGKVQDLIHPSMYPYVHGVSYDVAPDRLTARAPSPPRGVAEAEAEEKRMERQPGLDELEDEYGFNKEEELEFVALEREVAGLDSIYQWLPAEFDVGLDGEVSIASYINNLDRARHPQLYDTIARVFRLFLPLFEETVALRSPGQLYGRRLQAIVKAANYVLRPGQSYEGSWHVEGMRHERIVASGIYYYATTPNLAGTESLAFRAKRENSYTTRAEDSHNSSFNINLGRIETPAGRCLVFANDLQHRVKGLRLDDSAIEPGVRKILCFFLVDPDRPIKSSRDVPPQQWEVERREVARAVAKSAARLGVRLPREVVVMITEAAKWGFTRAEAEKHREVLMEERKYFVGANNRLWERPFSFCEH